MFFLRYHIEEPAFILLAAATFGGFAVHYWLPTSWKQPFFALLSAGGAFLLVEPLVATLVLATVGLIYAAARMPASYPVRVGAIGAVFGALMLGRAYGLGGVPDAFWPVIGALLMFRLLIYVYDLRHMKEPPGLTEFAAYFLMLPNFYFLFFPVVDFQTMRKSFLRRPAHEIAQTGVTWMVRGGIQLLVYRVVLNLKGPGTPDAVTTLPQLAACMLLVYMLYLRVSGTFHVIIGMLHLFGYDLPETHRRYLLARSLTDFWRRINIYWKDFMVKLVYLPAYFRFRRSGPVRAQVIATALVFLATWAFHSYQYFWMGGEFLLSWPDTLFWGVLGVLVIGNLLLELRAKAREARPDGPVIGALKTAGTFTFIVVLWSMWNSSSMGAWFDLLTYWKVG